MAHQMQIGRKGEEKEKMKPLVLLRVSEKDKMARVPVYLVDKFLLSVLSLFLLQKAFNTLDWGYF